MVVDTPVEATVDRAVEELVARTPVGDTGISRTSLEDIERLRGRLYGVVSLKGKVQVVMNANGYQY